MNLEGCDFIRRSSVDEANAGNLDAVRAVRRAAESADFLGARCDKADECLLACDHGVFGLDVDVALAKSGHRVVLCMRCAVRIGEVRGSTMLHILVDRESRKLA